MARLHIPAFINYRCQACGRCCHDYEVTLSQAEYERLHSYDWANIFPQLAGRQLFERSHRADAAGPYRIHFDATRGCSFLAEDGRCLMHAHVGYKNKGLACRLFPFTFAAAPDGIYVGMRFNCAAVARGWGEPLQRQREDIEALWEAVSRRGQLRPFPTHVAFSTSQIIPWRDYLVAERVFLNVLLRPDLALPDRIEVFWRAISLMREARLDRVSGARFPEFMALITQGVASEMARDTALCLPGPVTRALFRQILFLLHRRTPSAITTLGLRRRITERLAASADATRFLLKRGRSRLHGQTEYFLLQAVEQVPLPDLTPEVSGILERYLAAKLFGKQIFGPMFFNYDFVRGCAFLLGVFAAIPWYARARALSRGADAATEGDIAHAVEYVDFTCGYSDFPALVSERLRLRLLARGDVPLQLVRAQCAPWWRQASQARAAAEVPA